MHDPIRIAISGAAGRVGYSLVFRIAAGGMFGAEQPVILSLFDLPEVHDHLLALEMELRDCAFPMLTSLHVGSDPHAAFAGAHWVILLGGRPLGSAAQSRFDLIHENGPIFVEHGRVINEVCPTARILVVANPCNTNCLIAMRHAQDVPAERWFALNRIDRMRATALIAEKAGVHICDVTRVAIWGNHSEQTYVDLHNAFINDRPAYEVITDPNWSRNVLQPWVHQRSREIHQLRGNSPAATAAQAILGTVRSISTPTPFQRRFGAAVVSDGSYGVPRGLVFGFPLVSSDGHSWSIVEGLYVDDYAQQRLAANVAELEHEAALAEEMLNKIGA